MDFQLSTFMPFRRLSKKSFRRCTPSPWFCHPLPNGACGLPTGCTSVSLENIVNPPLSSFDPVAKLLKVLSFQVFKRNHNGKTPSDGTRNANLVGVITINIHCINVRKRKRTIYHNPFSSPIHPNGNHTHLIFLYFTFTVREAEQGCFPSYLIPPQFLILLIL